MPLMPRQQNSVPLSTDSSPWPTKPSSSSSGLPCSSRAPDRKRSIAGPSFDAINAAAAKLGPATDRFLPVADKTIVVVERAAVLIQSANQAATTANRSEEH